MLYEAIANKMLYGPVKSYNTTVYYIKGSGMITGIVSKGISEPVDRLTLFGVPSVWPFAKRLHITNR